MRALSETSGGLATGLKTRSFEEMEMFTYVQAEHEYYFQKARPATCKMTYSVAQGRTKAGRHISVRCKEEPSNGQPVGK